MRAMNAFEQGSPTPPKDFCSLSVKESGKNIAESVTKPQDGQEAMHSDKMQKHFQAPAAENDKRPPAIQQSKQATSTKLEGAWANGQTRCTTPSGRCDPGGIFALPIGQRAAEQLQVFGFMCLQSKVDKGAYGVIYIYRERVRALYLYIYICVCACAIKHWEKHARARLRHIVLLKPPPQCAVLSFSLASLRVCFVFPPSIDLRLS